MVFFFPAEQLELIWQEYICVLLGNTTLTEKCNGHVSEERSQIGSVLRSLELVLFVFNTICSRASGTHTTGLFFLWTRCLLTFLHFPLKIYKL